MRLAHHRAPDGDRLVARTPEGWVDLAAATGDERLRRLSGLLDAGDAAREAVDAALASTSAPARIGDDVPLGPALDRPGRIFCIGRNYVDHRDELDGTASPWPEVFLRLPTSVTGPHDDVPRPSVTRAFDYEGELGVVIGRAGRHVAPERALEHVLGYVAVNDLTARDWQKRGEQWTSGKNFDGTLPVGPCLVTADELDASDLALRTRVNGREVQSARTSQLLFDLGAQLSFLSSFTALRPGDLICTGTPGGVGIARTPQLLLTDGDVVEVELEGVGILRNRVVDDGLEPASSYWPDVAGGRD